MSRCVTRVVDFVGGAGYQATCSNHPKWIAPSRELASTAIEDCKHHKALNLASDVCITLNCGREARMSIDTKRPSRMRIFSVVDFDNRPAPKTADRYCRKHGALVIVGMIETLVDMDEEETDGTGSGEHRGPDSDGTGQGDHLAERETVDLGETSSELAQDGATQGG